MKTNKNESTLHTTPASRVRGLKSILFATLTAFALLGFTHAGSGSDACSVNARYVYYSDMNNARSDYYVALATANNEPTAPARAEARDQARDDYSSAQDDARARFRARRDLCDRLDEDRYNPVIAPANFLSPAEIATSPNPLYPLIPGATMNYRSPRVTVAVTVTHETRTIHASSCATR